MARKKAQVRTGPLQAVRMPPPNVNVFGLGEAGCSVCVPEDWTRDQVVGAIEEYTGMDIKKAYKIQKCHRHPARLHWSVTFAGKFKF